MDKDSGVRRFVDKDPGNVMPYETLWAVLSRDSDGNEGLCAINTPIGPQVAITGSERVLELYLEAIKGGEAEAKAAKKQIVVGTFSRTATRNYL